MSKQKQTVVSFRVDQHLAEILDHLPDKSTFIREAILGRFHTVCPFCHGHGVLPPILAEWLEANTPEYESLECTCCHYAYPAELIPADSRAAARDFVCPHCREHDHRH